MKQLVNNKMSHPRKLNGKWVRNYLFKTFFTPRNYLRFFKYLRNQQAPSTTLENAQLKLYSQILPGDFLHYGYFENPDVTPEEISLQDFFQAQLCYAKLIMEQAIDKNSPVLDAGCGNGGMIDLLLRNGFSPVGLTPDRSQVEYIKNKNPRVQIIHSPFEKISVQSYQQYFGTVIHSESLQYMNLDEAIAAVNEILRPQGRWIVADYFRTGEMPEKSGFYWDVFLQKLGENNFKVVYERDITANICPTLAYIYMWGNKIGLPFAEFAISKLERKRPAIFYWLGDLIAAGKNSLLKQLEIVNPAAFSEGKKYMLLSIERDTQNF